MRTVEQTANELAEKFIQAQDNTKFETSDENYRKCQSLNEELGSDVEVYWKRLAIQCAIIAVGEIVESSPSLPILSDSGIYSDDIKLSTEYWQQVKQELETRLNK